jgi:drug/metabolite transporter (DMT)-like permease
MLKTEETKGVASLILLSFFFGATAISVRYLGLSLPLFQQVYLTTLIGFLMSLFIFKKKLTISRLRQISGRDWGVIMFRIMVGYFIAIPLYRESIAIAKISNVTFIQSIPFAAIFGWLIFKDKFNLSKRSYILLAFVGVVLIAVSDFSSLLVFGKGELYSLVSAAFFSLTFLASKWQTKKITDLEITQIILFLSSIILFIASLLLGEGLPKVEWTWVVFWALLFTGFFNAVNNFFINYGFRRVKAVLAGNIIMLESVFAMALAFIFFKELPNVKEFLGGALIVGSVIQMNRLRDG